MELADVRGVVDGLLESHGLIARRLDTLENDVKEASTAPQEALDAKASKATQELLATRIGRLEAASNRERAVQKLEDTMQEQGAVLKALRDHAASDQGLALRVDRLEAGREVMARVGPELEQRLAAAQSQLQHLVEDYAGQVDELHSRLANEHQDRRLAHEQHRGELGALDGALRQRSAASAAQLATLRAHSEGAVAGIQVNGERLNALRQSVRLGALGTAALRSRVGELEVRAESHESTLRAMAGWPAALQESQDAASALRSKMAQLEAASETGTARVDELASEVRERTRATERAAIQIEEVHAAADRNVADLVTLRSHVASDVSKTQDALQVLLARMPVLESAYQVQLDELRDSLAGLCSRVDSGAAGDAQKQEAALTARVAAVEETFAEAVSDSARAGQVVQELRQAMEDQNTAARRGDADMQSIRDSLQGLTSRFNELDEATRDGARAKRGLDLQLKQLFAEREASLKRELKSHVDQLLATRQATLKRELESYADQLFADRQATLKLKNMATHWQCTVGNHWWTQKKERKLKQQALGLLLSRILPVP
eukprot:g8037.t1